MERETGVKQNGVLDEKNRNHRGQPALQAGGCSSATLEGLQTWAFRTNFYEELVPGAN